jgi:hypothetical protein
MLRFQGNPIVQARSGAQASRFAPSLVVRGSTANCTQR